MGGVAAAVDAVARRLGCPPLLAAIWTVGAAIALTGALHEDGLADTADAMGSRHDAARTLAIMRDSRIGTFGTIALVLSLAARIAAIAALPHPAAALLAAAVTGRAAMVLPLLVLSPARPDGLGASLRAMPAAAGVAALAIGAAIDLALLPLGTALAALALAGLVAAALTRLARQRIGGFTGDILGAVEQAAEVLTLCAVVAA